MMILWSSHLGHRHCKIIPLIQRPQSPNNCLSHLFFSPIKPLLQQNFFLLFSMGRVNYINNSPNDSGHFSQFACRMLSLLRVYLSFVVLWTLVMFAFLCREQWIADILSLLGSGNRLRKLIPPLFTDRCLPHFTILADSISFEWHLSGWIRSSVIYSNLVTEH